MNEYERVVNEKAREVLRKLYDRADRAKEPAISPLQLAQRAYYEVLDPAQSAPLDIQDLAIRRLRQWASEVCAERNRTAQERVERRLARRGISWSRNSRVEAGDH